MTESKMSKNLETNTNELNSLKSKWFRVNLALLYMAKLSLLIENLTA